MNTENSPRLDLNQSSLQDFKDCHRRFELKYIVDALWPAAPSSPLSKYETLAEIGTQFHALCQQFFIGLEPEHIAAKISDQDLLQLWEAFLPYGKSLVSFPVHFEQILRVPFENHFLVAKFDLLVQKPEGDYLIIDWKTSRNKPSRTDLANRVQTFLYPFIFQQAGNDLFGVDAIPPSQITMQYWYPLSSEPEEIFPFSQSKHEEVSSQLTDTVAHIDRLISRKESFPLTEDIDRCKYCRFRSFCERGHTTHPLPAGAEIENEDLANSFFDWDLIKEIEY